MDFLNIRAEYIWMAHFLYFFISMISLAFALLSFDYLWIAFFLFMVSFGNIFISLVTRESVKKYFSENWDSYALDYLLLFFMAVSFVMGSLYLWPLGFETLQSGVIIGSWFLFFWAFLNYIFTRVSVIRNVFRIVHLTKYSLGVERIFSILTDPSYEGLVDVLNLIDSRLVEYYEPGSCEVVDELLLKIADEVNPNKLRRLVVQFGVELYDYSIGVLVREQDEKNTDNSVLIRRFGYKKKLLELVGE